MAGKFYFIVALICIVPIIYACNEAICASVVSKCMLTQSCKCDLKDCSCCKDCFNCLSYLYSECCSCVDMCPKPNDTRTELSKTSYVEELDDGVPGLFSALTIDPDPQERWLSITFPTDIDISAVRLAAENKLVYHLQSVEQESIPESRNVVTINCTVAYMSQCMSCDKCRYSCRSMGATSLRWFHDGCCECIGDKCLLYGINENKCLACPGNGKSIVENDLDDDLTYEDLDYGEDVDTQSI
ncbi:protein twisted gastrulation-like [Hyposmocoma kahamanoa]|uniref:protein twisted gastrulation-like n=1 Tax=Hyposmocoma kahamanoa TaxID=1477025 RepID=UPI000E6D6769|nr:protein twisted gastrulation-like [Hyposmocoma kahamanoa]